MKRALGLAITAAFLTRAGLCGDPAGGARPSVQYRPITAPLKQSRNPHYFEDAYGNPFILCGSHSWNTLQDWGTNDAVRAIDFRAFIHFLQEHGHNFTLLWSCELPHFHGLPSTET